MTAREAAYDIVALASSAGGINALVRVLSVLPADFPAALVVVQHLPAKPPSLLPEILRRNTPLEVVTATAGERVTPGVVYVAPTDHHLLIRSDGVIELTQTELVHFVRPSADLLFESVAAGFRTRAIAVVLTGTGVDGATGVVAIRKMGGCVIVQDKGSSEFFGMPAAAIGTGDVAHVLPLEEIGPKLLSLMQTGAAA